jgi:hypothetical protein
VTWRRSTRELWRNTIGKLNPGKREATLVLYAYGYTDTLAEKSVIGKCALDGEATDCVRRHPARPNVDSGDDVDDVEDKIKAQDDGKQQEQNDQNGEVSHCYGPPQLKSEKSTPASS